MLELIRQSKWFNRFMVCWIVYVLAVFNGCKSPEPQMITPAFELPAEFSDRGSEPMSLEWWQSLGDAELNTIIEEALTDNFSIRTAWDRLTQAEQTAIKAGVDSYPSATYQAGADRQRLRSSGNTSYTSNYFAGLAAAYEVDLWGGIRSSRQAAVLDAQAAQENVKAAAMTLTSAIAKTWYQLADAKQQQRIITEQIATNEKILEVITLQFRQAQVGAADVFSQQQLIQSRRGQLITVNEDVTLLQHQLSVLMGKTPGEWWSDRAIDLITLKGLPKIDVPAVIIQRRPDVMSAYRAVEAADQRLAVAIADQYPTISLSAGLETSGAKAHDLFDAWLANLAANISGPLFDAGYRKAEVQRRKAVLSEKLNEYSQSVLEALQETEDAISREYYQRQYVESLQKQLSLAQNVYERTYQNYLKGQLDYIRVLTALISMQNLEQNELTSRRILIEHRIDLCRSIAGGWPMQRPDDAELLKTSFLDNEE